MDAPQENEVFLKDQNGWLYFRNPHQIILAENHTDVPGALAEVERLVEERNWYAAGFVSYEAAPAFDPALRTHSLTGFPYLWFGLYPQPQILSLPKPQHSKPTLNWQPAIDRTTYSAAIDKVREYIAHGRTYQVNYTMRLQTQFDANAWDFFLHFAQTQNQYAAFLDTGRFAICSASPELFFELDRDIITSRPMKGTVRRGRTTREDRAMADWLRNSEKNRAENVMIVDMVRNDLGRIAQVGSVHVPELFRAERYPTLWQMTSTVRARTNASLSKIFTALFPCASITGAPKVSTMEIIHELEPTPRSIYTGTIGYLFPGGKARFNVAIRTALIDQKENRAEYGVGGGIVWDSTSSDEYSEALLKARVLAESPPTFSLLETMLWTPEEGFFLKSKHLERLIDSAHYFDFTASQEAIEDQLDQVQASFHQPQRVRLLLDRDGTLEIRSTPLFLEERPVQACLADRPVNTDNIFLFHKTTQREVYESARAGRPDCEEVLLYNEQGELTEFTIGNLVVELDGELITPPVECGLLPGTFRSHLIEMGEVIERIVPVHRLKECAKVFRVNSVRKWETVQIQYYNSQQYFQSIGL